MLYEMAKGTRPAPAVRLRVEASPELERIVSKCLETIAGSAISMRPTCEPISSASDVDRTRR